MKTRQTVNYQLAFKTKKHADAHDYRVLACSEGPLGVEDFEVVYNRLSVGTMPFKATYEGERSPWLTFGAVELAGVTYFAAIRQEWTNRTDARSRPVHGMSCICFPYEELAKRQLPYAAVLKDIPDLGAFLQAGGGLTAQDEYLPADSEEQWRAAAEVVDEVGFEYCASIAALLVKTPVAIVKGHGLTVDERLSYLDAIVGLLPYGARASLNVSTWMYSASSGTAHLGFSEGARREQQRIAWGEKQTESLVANSGAGEYLDLLMSIRSRRSTLDIVRSLAGKTTPITPGDEKPFIDALRSVDHWNFLWQDVKDGVADAAEIRRAFREDGPGNISEEQRVDLLAVLLPSVEADDVELLKRHWSKRLEVSAYKAVASLLQGPGQFHPDRLWMLCSLAAETKWLALYFDALLLNTPGNATITAFAAELLYNNLRSLDGKDEQRIRERLIANKRMLYEIAFHVSELPTQSAKQWLNWLKGKDRAVDAELDIFEIATGLKKKDASLQQMRTLGGVSDSAVARLVRLAADVASKTRDPSVLERLTSVASAWLLESLEGLDDAGRAEWSALLRLVKKRPVRTDFDGAKLDVLSLALLPKDGAYLLGGYLPKPQGVFRSYGQNLIGLLNCLDEAKQGAVETLLAYCSTLGVGNTKEYVNLLHFYEDILQQVTSEGAREALCGGIVKALEAEPDLLFHEAFTSCLKGYLLDSKYSGGLFKAYESKLRRTLSSEATVEDVAAVVDEMLSLRHPDKELKVIKILDQKKFLADPEQIEDFIDVLEEQMGHDGTRTLEARERAHEFHKALVRHDSDSSVLYRQYLGGRLLNELKGIDLLTELVGEELDAKRSEEVSVLVDRIYGRLKKDGFFKHIFSKKR